MQLYTVRDALDADREGTLRAVAEIGYREVELAGLSGGTAHAMQASLKRCGLDAPSMHASYDRLRGDFDSVLKEARPLGARFLVCPSVDAGERETAEAWRTVCKTLNGIGRVARSLGWSAPMSVVPHWVSRAASSIRILSQPALKSRGS